MLITCTLLSFFKISLLAFAGICCEHHTSRTLLYRTPFDMCVNPNHLCARPGNLSRSPVQEMRMLTTTSKALACATACSKDGWIPATQARNVGLESCLDQSLIEALQIPKFQDPISSQVGSIWCSHSFNFESVTSGVLFHIQALYFATFIFASWRTLAKLVKNKACEN